MGGTVGETRREAIEKMISRAGGLARVRFAVCRSRKTNADGRRERREEGRKDGLFSFVGGSLGDGEQRPSDNTARHARRREEERVTSADERRRRDGSLARSLAIDAFFLMKGSGGWSDSLTCSIGGCRCRRGYRGGRSRVSRRSSPLLLLPQCSLLPCLP